MKLIIVVPGLMGTKLYTENEDRIFPPTLREVILGGGRKKFDKLMSDTVTLLPKKILSTYCRISVYQKLLKALADVPGSKLETFPYDWRHEPLEVAKQLRAYITQKISLQESSTDHLYLIGHSMGGIIIRIMVEFLKPAAAFLGLIRYVFLCGVPFYGTPKAYQVLSKDVDAATEISGANFWFSQPQLKALAHKHSGILAVILPTHILLNEKKIEDLSRVLHVDTIDLYMAQQIHRCFMKNARDGVMYVLCYNVSSPIRFSDSVNYFNGKVPHDARLLFQNLCMFNENLKVTLNYVAEGDGTINAEYSNLSLLKNLIVVFDTTRYKHARMMNSKFLINFIKDIVCNR